MPKKQIVIPIPNQNMDTPEFWTLVLINGEITEDTGAEVTRQLMSIELHNRSNGTNEPATMIINSPGGDLNAAWQICDIMDFISTPIHTVGLGQVCSAGLMILMNGTVGERRVTDRTSIMSHQYSWGAIGKHSDLIATSKEWAHIMTRLVKHYKECTGLTEKELMDNLLKDTDRWLTAQEAKKYGLIDEITISNKTKRINLIKKGKTK
jgi:ATP-dependent Clp protease protease subunit